MGISVFTGGKSTTLSEVSLFKFITRIVIPGGTACVTFLFLWTGDQKNWTMN